jgi:hypothetical protein
MAVLKLSSQVTDMTSRINSLRSESELTSAEVQQVNENKVDEICLMLLRNHTKCCLYYII